MERLILRESFHQNADGICCGSVLILCLWAVSGTIGDPFPLAPDSGRLEEEEVEVVRASRCLACTL